MCDIPSTGNSSVVALEIKLLLSITYYVSVAPLGTQTDGYLNTIYF